MPENVTIVGGGLAGLTLGIGLLRRGVPVTVWEAGSYPRHRVCGEFISGNGQNSLARLGLLDGLQTAGACSAMDADLEMHFVPSGYVGLCKLASGEVNICGLFRSKATVPDLSQRWRDWLGGPVASVLHSRLAVAHFEVDSFCSVAGLCLRPQCAIQRNECCIGDALTMIPPVTGNGMSMAFESAELAIEPLAKFSRGELTWAEATQETASRCDMRFTARLRWAAWLQRALFQPCARSVLMFLTARSDWLWREIFERTR
jgi:2-polyprenyl-6-methoxyphenol hydroxylase-like FAD-dependent oxidoreductase